MASASEIILPIGTQKHDPAWKHCLMIRSAGRTKLKCMYCMKLFLGGGIHRIKEHLARQKGNASCCPKVPPEVQLAMQQSLDGSAARKRKKIKLMEEVKKLNPGQVEGGENMEAGIPLIQLPPDGMLELGPVQVEVREEVPLVKTSERGRRKKAKFASPPPPQELLHYPQPPATVPDNVKLSMVTTVDRDQVYMAIGRFLYEAGVPLDAVNSAYFQPMIDTIAAAGPGLEAFSYHDFRGWILKRSIDEVNNTLENYKVTWSRTGCSVLADEWTTDAGKMINIFVYCPEGTMFLRSFDASNIDGFEDTLYHLLQQVVEQVGERNVVQVITNNKEYHIGAAKKLNAVYPTLFWTGCASHFIEEMLEEIGKLTTISEILEKAKSVTRFIYNHAVVLNIMKKYTNGRDLLLPGGNRIAMNFITLRSISSMKEELRNMISSAEWMASPYSEKPGGILLKELFCDLDFWSCCNDIIRITEPALRVLNLVESNKRPAIGYIYVALYYMKQQIKKELGKNAYSPVLENIDFKLKQQLAHPLYAAGFFLNPRFFYCIQGEISNEISSGMLDCIERLVPEGKIQDKIQKELNMYKTAAGDFGRKMAVRARDTLLPAEWWSTYGGACPNLTRLAIRILSQTCSSRGCERVHIPFEQIHNKKMSILEHQRLCDITFVRYNLRLQQRQALNCKLFDPISVDNIDTFGDWVVEENNLLSGLSEGDHWMLLNQPVSDMVPSAYLNDEEDEIFIAGLSNEVIQGAGQQSTEEEDEDHNLNSFS